MAALKSTPALTGTKTAMTQLGVDKCGKNCSHVAMKKLFMYELQQKYMEKKKLSLKLEVLHLRHNSRNDKKFPFIFQVRVQQTKS